MPVHTPHRLCGIRLAAKGLRINYYWCCVCCVSVALFLSAQNKATFISFILRGLRLEDRSLVAVGAFRDAARNIAPDAHRHPRPRAAGPAVLIHM